MQLASVACPPQYGVSKYIRVRWYRLDVTGRCGMKVKTCTSMQQEGLLAASHPVCGAMEFVFNNRSIDR